VIGAGMVGVCAALWLQRDGHSVFLVEPGNPGEGASFGNAGCFNGSSVTPMAMPGIIKNVPRWLMDPIGPLALRWSYLPSILPYLYRFMRAATPEKVHAQAKALRPRGRHSCWGFGGRSAPAAASVQPRGPGPSDPRDLKTGVSGLRPEPPAETTKRQPASGRAGEALQTSPSGKPSPLEQTSPADARNSPGSAPWGSTAGRSGGLP